MIAIIDYGLGNIKAFANVYKKINIPYCFANTAEQLILADKIILPGVGAFDHAMSMLNHSGLRDTLDYLVLEKKLPVLGVCVGMQMMADSSEEGVMRGLGWISGKVKKISLSEISLSKKYPLPHMGWNSVDFVKESSIFKGDFENSRFYFLHSYYFECAEDSSSLASTEYGLKFSSVVNSGNVYGIQCHPEKSHGNGIQLLKNFSDI